MKLVWNKDSSSNIKLCPISIIADLSIGWEQGHSLSSGLIPTYRLDNNLELMSSIMECRRRREERGRRRGVAWVVEEVSIGGKEGTTKKVCRVGDGERSGWWGGKMSGGRGKGEMRGTNVEMFGQKVSCWETPHFLPFPLIIPPQDRGGGRREGEKWHFHLFF